MYMAIIANFIDLLQHNYSITKLENLITTYNIVSIAIYNNCNPKPKLVGCIITVMIHATK